MFFLVKWVDARDIVSALHPGNLRNLCKGSSTFSTQTSARQYLTSHLKVFNGELLRSNFDDNRFFWFKWSVWDIATQEKVYWVLLQAKNTLRHIHIEQRLSPSRLRMNVTNLLVVYTERTFGIRKLAYNFLLSWNCNHIFVTFKNSANFSWPPKLSE